MNAIAELTINRNIELVWNIMGEDFANVHQWATNFTDSKASGEKKFDGLDYSSRTTITERGTTVQTLDAYSPEKFSLEYTITEGAPEIAKVASSKWSLEKISDNETKVILDFYLEPKMELPAEMAEKVKMGIYMGAKTIAEELKYFLENGEAHPNKIQQLKTV